MYDKPAIFNPKFKFLLFITLAIFFISKNTIAQSNNLILNPSFENIDTSITTNAENWTKKGSSSNKITSIFGADNATYHSGESSMKVDITSVTPESNEWISIKISSTPVPLPEAGTWMTFQVWMRVVYENNSNLGPMGLVYLRFLNNTGGQVGSFVAMHNGDENDWHLREKLIQVPAGATKAVVELGVYNNIGTIWFDDVALTDVYSTEQKNTLSSAIQSVLLPHLIPEPQIRGNSFTKRAVNDIGFIFDETIEPKLGKAIDRDFNWNGLNVTKYSSAPSTNHNHDLLVHFVDWASVNNLKYEKFPNSNFIVENAEAYALLWDGNDVYAASDIEAGHFYALQTLRQMLPKKNWPKGSNTFALSSVNILDQPSLGLRGIVFGRPNWEINETLTPRVSRFKGNSILLPGAGFSNRLSNEWRTPLKTTDIQDLISFVNLSNEHFIKPIFGISPRGKKTNGIWVDLPVEYSNSNDVDLAVSKLAEGYNAGFRHFLMNYNDLKNYSNQDVLYHQSDKDQYANIVDAHIDFLNQVYNKFTATRQDVAFYAIPMHYSGYVFLPEIDRAYPRAFNSVNENIIMFVVPKGTNDIDLTNQFMPNHTTMMWDNAYTKYDNPPFAELPRFMLPKITPFHTDTTTFFGKVFLPPGPIAEDDGLMAFRMWSGLQWAPNRFDSDRNFASALSTMLEDNSNINAELFEILYGTPTFTAINETFNTSITANWVIGGSNNFQTPTVSNGQLIQALGSQNNFLSAIGTVTGNYNFFAHPITFEVDIDSWTQATNEQLEVGVFLGARANGGMKYLRPQDTQSAGIFIRIIQRVGLPSQVVVYVRGVNAARDGTLVKTSSAKILSSTNINSLVITGIMNSTHCRIRIVGDTFSDGTNTITMEHNTLIDDYWTQTNEPSDEESFRFGVYTQYGSTNETTYNNLSIEPSLPRQP